MRLSHQLVEEASKIEPPEDRVKAAVCLDLKRLSGSKPLSHVYNTVAMGIFLSLSTVAPLPQRCANKIAEYLVGAPPPHDDCYQTETNIVLAALLGCNTNVSPLGGLTQAANAMFYLMGYLSKNPIKPCHWVTCMTAARKSARKYGSRAEDAGTTMRNAVFLLQNMLNRLTACAEVADTQGSMFLLGEPSWVSSHPFRFCFIQAAVEYQLHRLCQNVTPDNVSGGSQSSEEHSQLDESMFSHPSINSSAENSSSQQVPCVSGSGGGGVLYTDSDGNVHAVSQHEFYKDRVFDWDALVDGVVPDMRWWYENARGVYHAGWKRWNLQRGLETLNFLQYVTHIEIVPKPKNFDECACRGRQANMFLLNASHPLHDSHIQRLRARDHIPALSGKAPARPRGECPKTEGRQKREWMLRADTWAMYIGTLLSPWDRDGIAGVRSYAGLQKLMNTWRARSNRDHWHIWAQYIKRDRESDMDMEMPAGAFPDASGDFFMDYENNVKTNLRVPHLRKALVNGWRYANADRFSTEEQTKAILHGGNMRSKTRSEENALAIARLIDTRKKNNDGGLKQDTRDHLGKLLQQLERIDSKAQHVHGSTPSHPRGLAVWDAANNGLDAAWANHRREELKQQEPEQILEEEIADASKRVRPDDMTDLRSGDPTHRDPRRRHPLSADQAAAFDIAVTRLRSGKQLLMFVHGPPGTGKTVLAGRITAAAKRLSIKSQFAALSGAAATLGNGTTIHYLANLGIAIPPHHSKVSAQTVKTMRERGGKYELLTIDEISMVHAKLFSAMEHRFTEADMMGVAESAKITGRQVLWGGMHVILLGDMLQLPPPTSFVKAMYVDCVDETAGGSKYNKEMQLYHGIEMFRRFIKAELTTQNRAKGDQVHTRLIHRLRTHAQPVSTQLLSRLQMLSGKDVCEYRWKFAPRLVTSNLERFMINKHQVLSFARATQRCVYTWVDRMTNAPLDVSEDENEDLDPSARRYFVYGAPAYITQNINSAATGLVNGSKGYLHSLTWNVEDTRAEQLPPHGDAGELVQVPVPLSVNIFVPGQDCEDDMDEENFAHHLIPVFATPSNTEKGSAVLSRQRHAFDLGFCITYHKVQGQTLNEVVLVLHERKPRQLLSLCFEMLYVALTRVRRTADIRVLYFEDGNVHARGSAKRKRCGRKRGRSKEISGLQHLLRLKRPKHFDAWLACYDKSGNWDEADLKVKAARDRDKAVRALARPLSLTDKTYTIPFMKSLVKALGLTVQNAPGKKYARKEQFWAALYPEWVKQDSTRSVPERFVKGLEVAGASKVVTRTRKEVGQKHSRSVGKRNNDTDARNRTTHLPRLRLDHMPQATLQSAKDALLRLRARVREATERELWRTTCAVDVPYVGTMSEYEVASILDGRMMYGSVLHSGALLLCAGSRVLPVDPIAVKYIHVILERGALARARGVRQRGGEQPNILQKLQSGHTIMLPFNLPANLHWIGVFAWLGSDATVYMCHANSSPGLRSFESQALRLGRKFLQTLYDDANYRPQGMTPFTLKTVQCSVPSQVGGSMSCGEHTIAACALAVRGVLTTHTFDLPFVTRTRERVMNMLMSFKPRRRRRDVPLSVPDRPNELVKAVIDLT